MSSLANPTRTPRKCAKCVTTFAIDLTYALILTLQWVAFVTCETLFRVKNARTSVQLVEMINSREIAFARRSSNLGTTPAKTLSRANTKLTTRARYDKDEEAYRWFSSDAEDLDIGWLSLPPATHMPYSNVHSIRVNDNI
ncbi:hypothetical protein HPB51_028484 [Rhipicephalus microplus]|uniref:Uncharacterized protein n=1 Tax=Rhipicephalus microplus TaxID=6941 RepID=A0A9J6CWS4_RHIMP|nr:hypothetical protein HPB51_028484 [Rhipicephalus microplus]